MTYGLIEGHVLNDEKFIGGGRAQKTTIFPDLMAAECKVGKMVEAIVDWLNESGDFVASLTAKSEPTSESDDWSDEKSALVQRLINRRSRDPKRPMDFFFFWPLCAGQTDSSK